MFGLAVLVVGAIYLVVLIAVTRIAFAGAKKRGYSTAKCWLAAAVGFLIVYLPIFWDHIPTMIAHQHYCATGSGFKIFKTIEQWKKENPGVAEKLKPYGNDINEMPRTAKRDALLNERFLYRFENISLRFFPNWRRTISLIDRETGEVVASDVDFHSGYGNPMTSVDPRSWKFWLQIDSCLTLEKMQANRGFVDYMNQIVHLGANR